ncbi:MAG: indolepyruvate ferredoxin oxidoreductase subunit alpha [Clostridiales bacterium]|nr:indolepyruvate ferredoxin oxidoreductase subunit alpha [Clostridiales bacterium]
MLGNQAVARGAFEAGVRVVSSYPGTPSTEITEYISKYDEVYAEWAPNEKVALEVAIGAAIGGGRAMSCMKHVGLNVAADPLFTVSYTGVNGGLVICVADDPGMHSSQNEQDSRHFAKASKTMMLAPADSAECKAFVKQAFDLSEQFDTPVLIGLSTRVSHSQSLVVTEDRVEKELPPYEKNPGKYVMMPAMARGRHDAVEDRILKQKEFAETTELNRTEYHSKKIGIITAGISYQYAKEALGESASYLKLGVVYPLPEKRIRDFVASVDICYVAEELDPIIEEHCKTLGLSVIGKEKFSLKGEYSAEMIRNVILNEKTAFVTRDEQIPGRPPVMCAGCPHRAVFTVLNRLKAVVSGDIGCYTLAALPPLNAIDACICMGASVSMAHGMEKARGRAFSKNTVAVIGDSTFMHSGITGLVDVVYNKGNSTVIILDNSITGMTGHQDNPTTGKTIKGEPTKQVDLKKLCEAVGVDRVTVCDPFDADAFTEIVKREMAADEPSVIIAQRPCALLKSVNYTGKCVILKEKCKKCNLCIKTGCPAIIKIDGDLTIDPALCVGCAYCQRVCKFGAIEKGDH